LAVRLAVLPTRAGGGGRGRRAAAPPPRAAGHQAAAGPIGDLTACHVCLLL
jgi:hypothetical protein